MPISVRMVKHVLRWNNVNCKNMSGELFNSRLPRIIARGFRGRLLSEILAMKKKMPISFAAAVNIVSEKEREAFDSGQIGRNPGQYFWYSENFIQYISDLGYHIDLTGDEFEPYNIRDKVA